MSADTLIFIYVTAALAALAALAIYAERRTRSFLPTSSKDRVFRCGSCGLVYTDDPDVDRSRCPQCGKSNMAFKF